MKNTKSITKKNKYFVLFSHILTRSCKKANLALLPQFFQRWFYRLQGYQPTHSPVYYASAMVLRCHHPNTQTSATTRRKTEVLWQNGTVVQKGCERGTTLILLFFWKLQKIDAIISVIHNIFEILKGNYAAEYLANKDDQNNFRCLFAGDGGNQIQKRSLWELWCHDS